MKASAICNSRIEISHTLDSNNIIITTTAIATIITRKASAEVA